MVPICIYGISCDNCDSQYNPDKQPYILFGNTFFYWITGHYSVFQWKNKQRMLDESS